MVKDGISLLDFNSFPMRIREIPEEPYKGQLVANYLDALFLKSKCCISPSGWECESLPYLVEFEMPGNRMVTGPNESNGSYRANTRSEACPIGYSQEETIKKLWDTN